MAWIVARTKPNQEALASEHLTRQGYRPYCPRYQHKRPNKKTLIRPLFPRYIFVEIQDVWYSIRSTRGISSILSGDNGPQYVPEALVYGIMAREDKHGFIITDSRDRFERGASVKTEQGPLAGLPLIYDGMTANERCAVLVAMMDRYVRVEMEVKPLVAA